MSLQVAEDLSGGNVRGFVDCEDTFKDLSTRVWVCHDGAEDVLGHELIRV